MLSLDANRKLQNVGRSDLAGTCAENALASSSEEATAVIAIVGMSGELLAVGHTASRMASRISRVARQI